MIVTTTTIMMIITTAITIHLINRFVPFVIAEVVVGAGMGACVLGAGDGLEGLIIANAVKWLIL
jgi:hypothetical protein